MRCLGEINSDASFIRRRMAAQRFGADLCGTGGRLPSAQPGFSQPLSWETAAK
jgi:hypothetical protein